MNTETGILWFKREVGGDRRGAKPAPENMATITWPINSHKTRRYTQVRLNCNFLEKNGFKKTDQLVYGLSGPTLIIRRAEGWRGEEGYPMSLPSRQTNASLRATIPTHIVGILRKYGLVPDNLTHGRYEIAVDKGHLMLNLSKPMNAKQPSI